MEKGSFFPDCHWNAVSSFIVSKSKGYEVGEVVWHWQSLPTYLLTNFFFNFLPPQFSISPRSSSSFRSRRFLDAPSHLYKKSCPSVGPSVRPFVGTVLFSKVKSTHTRRVLCRVSGLVCIIIRRGSVTEGGEKCWQGTSGFWTLSYWDFDEGKEL